MMGTDLIYTSAALVLRYALLGLRLGFLSVLGAALLLGAIVIHQLYLQPFLFNHFSPLRHLPRVKERQSLLGGNIQKMMTKPPGMVELEWMQERDATVLVLPATVGTSTLFLADPAALFWVLSTQSAHYERSEVGRRILKMALGNGLLTADGLDHRRQRRIIAPAFHPSFIAKLVPVFFEKAEILVQSLLQDTRLTQEERYKSSADSHVVDLVPHLGDATLDVIGAAAFGHQFHSQRARMTGERNADDLAALFATFSKLGASAGASTARAIIFTLGERFPWLIDSNYTKRARKIHALRGRLEAVTYRILLDRRAEVLSSLEAEGERLDKPGKESEAFLGKDLLSRLLRANMAADLSASDRMTDEEMAGQITTFTFAGHETSQNAVSWLLNHLSHHPDAQAKLQREIDACYEDVLISGESHPSYDQVNALPYLNACLNESLRIAGIVTYMDRVAQRDDVIPLSRPLPRSDGRGTVDRIPVRKGQRVLLGLKHINLLPEIWGPDSHDFVPERWAALPKSHHDAHMPALQTYAFGHGPRSCVGNRFAMMESKCLAMTVLRHRTVQPTGDAIEAMHGTIVSRPYVVGRLEQGAQLPIRLVARQKS